jgi:hypothetical protein
MGEVDIKHIDLARIIGVNPDVAKFLSNCHRSNFAIDGAIEIIRAPLPSGWLPNSIQVELSSDNDYKLDAQAVRLLMPYKDKLVGSGWEMKYRVAVLKQIPHAHPVLQVVFVPISYEESAGFHHSLKEAATQRDDPVLALKERWASQLVQPGTYHLPGVAGVHVTVTTSDGQIILCRRSARAEYHPSHWSVSFEEQINEKDQLFGNAALAAAAIRGLQEEFVPDHTLKPENVNMLGVFVEYGILNLGFLMYIETSFCFDEIRRNWAAGPKDKWEATAVVGEPLTLGNVVRLLKSTDYGKTSDGVSRFHPTSKYRLLLVAIRRFGWDAVTNAFNEL